MKWIWHELSGMKWNGMKTILCACDSRLICMVLFTRSMFAHIWFQHTNIRTQHTTDRSEIYIVHTHTYIYIWLLSIIVHSLQYIVFMFLCVWVCTQPHANTYKNKQLKDVLRVCVCMCERVRNKNNNPTHKYRIKTTATHAPLPLEWTAYKTTLYEWSAIHFSIEIQCIQIAKFLFFKRRKK